jgi:hypothetical protein
MSRARCWDCKAVLKDDELEYLEIRCIGCERYAADYIFDGVRRPRGILFWPRRIMNTIAAALDRLVTSQNNSYICK